MSGRNGRWVLGRDMYKVGRHGALCLGEGGKRQWTGVCPAEAAQVFQRRGEAKSKSGTHGWEWRMCGQIQIAIQVFTYKCLEGRVGMPSS